MDLVLGNALGLAGFISRGGPQWGGFVKGLHEAYRSAGHYVGPGPLVDLGGDSVAVGSPAFEAALAELVAPYGLTRDEYGAIWFGEGSVDRWLRAGSTLLQGAEVTHQLREMAKAAGRERGGDDQASRSVQEWVGQLMVEARADVERLRMSEASTTELEERLLGLRADAAEVGGDLEVGLMAWVRERQDAETRLLLYRDRELELRTRLEQLEESGGDALCETCGRPLNDHHGDVHAARSEEWESTVQDGRWWRRRRDQLEFKPDDLKEVENRLLELEARIDETVEALERNRVQLRELEIARVREQHLEALVERMGGEASPDSGGAEASEEGALAGEDVGERLLEMRARLENAARSQFRDRVHAKVVALTDGRLVGAFPGLFADWSSGGRRGGGEVSILELAARITLAELAASAGVPLGSLVLPSDLDRLNGEDLPRALAELGRLTRRVDLILVKATEDVASSAPERFDLLFRVDDGRGAPRILRQRSGLGAIYLEMGAA